uniref:BZIP domain-containing protein n=1 Tax=Populus alba TaxID=43335 RepID=A0A4U5QMF8_POPAL|nr:hypothetical protein D5086_0000073620 [Populus alba]
MDSQWDYKNFGNAPPGQSSVTKPQENPSLIRQSSVYSLTFDEFQNTWGGGLRKDFWINEHGRTIEKHMDCRRDSSNEQIHLVWGVKEVPRCGIQFTQRQQTLGETTLEEFLVRAGVVREDTQQLGRPNNSGFFGELSLLNNNNNNDSSLAIGFQQPNGNNGLMGTRRMENNGNLVANQPSSLTLDAGGIRPTQQLQQSLQLSQQQQQLLFPKPAATVAFASPLHLSNSAQLASPGVRRSVVGIADRSVNNGLAHSGGMGIVSLATGGVTIATGSSANRVSPDVITKSNADTSSLSPVPYVFSRGRKASTALEKVAERRQRRMIKNRESAARSRTLKQAHTQELEAEVAKLKELNEVLLRKQAEIIEKQQNQFFETKKAQWGGKRQCLRRTVTGPW